MSNEKDGWADLKNKIEVMQAALDGKTILKRIKHAGPEFEEVHDISKEDAKEALKLLQYTFPATSRYVQRFTPQEYLDEIRITLSKVDKKSETYRLWLGNTKENVRNALGLVFNEKEEEQ